MFSKLSIRLGLLLFCILLFIELLLYGILYISLVDEREEEVVGQLLSRGNTHRDALEDFYDELTISHVIMMESASDFIVVITDGDGEVIGQSGPIDSFLRDTVQHADKDTVPHSGRILEARWRNHEYIATDSPITLGGQHYGHVYMFAPSNMIRETVGELGDRFMSIGAVSVILTLLVIPFLTRFITRPLLQMKQVTEQLALGAHQSGLETGRTDELGDLARSISRLSRDLDRVKNERNEFLASVAHELRTPLTYIKGYADLAARPGTTEDAREQYNVIIRDEARRLSGLVKQLFDLARLDQNDFIVNLSPVRLSPIAESVLTLVGPTFDEKGVRLTCKVPDNLSAKLDAIRFQQVLLNLLDNALKHTPSGREVVIQAVAHKSCVEVTVEDEGEGIPEEELSVIFERLYRVDKSRTRKSGGTGLGLAIVKEIVDAHGGTIRAESRLGEGTAITITLERAEENGTHPSGR